LQNGFDFGEKCFAKRSQIYQVALAIEEPCAKFVLQLHDLVRQRWLGDVFPLGRAGKTATLGYRSKIPKLMYFHDKPFLLSAKFADYNPSASTQA
jgi:hypothetical protein